MLFLLECSSFLLLLVRHLLLVAMHLFLLASCLFFKEAFLFLVSGGKDDGFSSSSERKVQGCLFFLGLNQQVSIVPSSFLLLVVRPGATSSVLATSCDALCS